MRQDGSTVSTELLQRPTNGHLGPDGVVAGWVSSVGEYLQANGLQWEQVGGVGVAVPGPRRSYGVLDSSPNLPASFGGFDVQTTYAAALSEKAGRPVPVYVANDGNTGGVAEAQRVRGSGSGSVVMLAPGSGLGAAYVDGRGLPLDGDTLAGMEGGHMFAPLHLLGVPAYTCGCGRTWGCIEMYTTLAGLPSLLAHKLETSYPDHPLATSTLGPKDRALTLRGLAQEGDALALELFDLQARALGYHVATLAMALDPEHVVIGGGLMDPGSTTDEFRERYLGILRASAKEFLWATQRDRINIVPATLGDLSQAIGAALVALYEQQERG